MFDRLSDLRNNRNVIDHTHATEWNDHDIDHTHTTDRDDHDAEEEPPQTSILSLVDRDISSSAREQSEIDLQADLMKELARLSADEFRVRQTAMGRLIAADVAALPVLCLGLKNSDPEVRKRCTDAAKKIISLYDVPPPAYYTGSSSINAGGRHFASLARLSQLSPQQNARLQHNLHFLRTVQQQFTTDNASTNFYIRLEEHQDLLKQMGALSIKIFGSSASFEKHARQLSSIKSLESLDVGDIRMTRRMINSIASVKSLRELHLSRSGIDDTDAASLAALPKLEVLRVSGAEFRGDGLSKLASCRNLHTLQFSGSGLSEQAYQSLTELPSLKTLELGSSSNLDSKGIAKISKCRSIESLKLQYVAWKDEWAQELRKMPALTELDLRGCNATDRSMEAIGAISTLRSLDLTGNQITDDGFAQLKHCSEMRKLVLAIDKISDRSLPVIDSMAKLEELDLAFTDVSSEVCEKLSHLSKLRILRLTGTAINDRTLSGLRAFPDLQELSLSGVDGFTDSGLDHLKQLSNLRKLNLYRTDISVERARSLKEKLPQCTICLDNETL